MFFLENMAAVSQIHWLTVSQVEFTWRKDRAQCSCECAYGVSAWSKNDKQLLLLVLSNFLLPVSSLFNSTFSLVLLASERMVYCLVSFTQEIENDYYLPYYQTTQTNK